MRLGMDTVQNLLESCDHLTGLGNLRTWADIDYYNAENRNYFNSESSALGKLKSNIIARNWDLDLDLETLDFLYKS